jgi:hypothetical protein
MTSLSMKLSIRSAYAEASRRVRTVDAEASGFGMDVGADIRAVGSPVGDDEALVVPGQVRWAAGDRDDGGDGGDLHHEGHIDQHWGHGAADEGFREQRQWQVGHGVQQHDYQQAVTGAVVDPGVEHGSGEDRDDERGEQLERLRRRTGQLQRQMPLLRPRPT